MIDNIFFNYDLMIEVLSYMLLAGVISVIFGIFFIEKFFKALGVALLLFGVLYVVVFVIANIVTNPL